MSLQFAEVCLYFDVWLDAEVNTYIILISKRVRVLELLFPPISFLSEQNDDKHSKFVLNIKKYHKMKFCDSLFKKIVHLSFV